MNGSHCFNDKIKEFYFTRANINFHEKAKNNLWYNWWHNELNNFSHNSQWRKQKAGDYRPPS